LDFGGTPVDGTSTSMGGATTEGKRGIAPVEMCTEIPYPCKANSSSFDSQNAQVGNISHWETFILLFFIFGHKELKVERKYRDKVFNGFINA